eukprot:EG_transcript_2245
MDLARSHLHRWLCQWSAPAVSPKERPPSTTLSSALLSFLGLAVGRFTPEEKTSDVLGSSERFPVAELNVVNVSHSVLRAGGQRGAAVLEELCLPSQQRLDGANQALFRCRRRLIVLDHEERRDLVRASTYLVPPSYHPGSVISLADLQPDPMAVPTTLLHHRDTFYLITTAALPLGTPERFHLWHQLHTWRTGEQLVVLSHAPFVHRAEFSEVLQGFDSYSGGEESPDSSRLAFQFQRRGSPRMPLNPSQLQDCSVLRPRLDGHKRRAAVPQENILYPPFVFDQCVLRALDQRPPPLHCAFIHGAGGESPEDTIVHDQFEFYWGKVHEWTPKCRTRWFLVANTINHGWDAEHLQRLVCQLVVGPRTGTNMVSHTTVFAHSMGNLLLAAALQKGYCEWDRPTNRWLSISGPWNAEAIPRLAVLCAKTNLLDVPVAYAANLLGFCLGDRASPGYASIDPEYPGLWRLLPYAKKFITGAMCGTSAAGLPHWLFTPALPAIGMLLNVDGPHDGVVSVESCARVIPLNGTWGLTPESPWYLADLNHVDTTGRHGNGRAPQQAPLMWFLIHHRHSRGERRGAGGGNTSQP